MSDCAKTTSLLLLDFPFPLEGVEHAYLFPPSPSPPTASAAAAAATAASSLDDQDHTTSYLFASVGTALHPPAAEYPFLTPSALPSPCDGGGSDDGQPSPASDGTGDEPLALSAVPLSELEGRVSHHVPEELFLGPRAQWSRFLVTQKFDASTKQLLQIIRRRKLSRRYAETTRSRRRERVADVMRSKEDLQAENDRLAAENAELRSQLQHLQAEMMHRYEKKNG
jgi:hypothetical protein